MEGTEGEGGMRRRGEGKRREERENRDVFIRDVHQVLL